MAYRDLQTDAGAVAEPEDVHLLEPELSHECRNVVGRRLERVRLIPIRRAAVPLLLDGNHPPVAGEERQHPAERDVNSRPPAVQEHERYAAGPAMDLVIHADAEDRLVSARLQRGD